MMQGHLQVNHEGLDQKMQTNGFHRLAHFQPQLIKTVLENYAEFYKLEIYFGWWNTILYVYQTNVPYHDLDRSEIGSGQYASVYKTPTNGKEVACKVFRKKKGQDFMIDQILKEVFIAKIASILEVGPRFETIYGYDLLITEDVVEYAMELCETNRMAILEEITETKIKKKSDLTEEKVKRVAQRV